VLHKKFITLSFFGLIINVTIFRIHAKFSF
jgi:hypothetical protein